MCFEERFLFEKVQEIDTAGELKAIKVHHAQEILKRALKISFGCKR